MQLNLREQIENKQNLYGQLFCPDEKFPIPIEMQDFACEIMQSNGKCDWTTFFIKKNVSVLSQASVLQNLRSAMRRQIVVTLLGVPRHGGDLVVLGIALFHRGSRLRGQIPLLTPPGHTHPDLSLHSYNTTDDGVEESCESAGQTPPPCSMVALGLALQAQH